MDFPPILKDFGSIDGASFDFDDFIFGTGDVEAVQSGVGTSAAVGAIEATRTSGGASSHPPRLSRGDPIPVVYSLETHAWSVHHRPVSHCLFCLLFASLIVAFSVV